MIEFVFNLEMILRLLIATAAGYAIGLERQITGHPAGDRTFALTALGACLFAVISTDAFPGADSRVAAGVVTGLGFLGAGMILKGEKQEVKGLTTAAGIWVAGGIGLAIGSGLYVIGLLSAALAMFVLASERILHVDARIAAWREARLRRQAEKQAAIEQENNLKQ